MTDRPIATFDSFSCKDVPANDISVQADWVWHTQMILNPLRSLTITAKVPGAKVGDILTLTESFCEPPRTAEYKVVAIEPDYSSEHRKFTFEEVRE